MFYRVGFVVEIAVQEESSSVKKSTLRFSINEKKILIMGGTRFIGVFLSRLLVKDGHQVIHLTLSFSLSLASGYFFRLLCSQGNPSKYSTCQETKEISFRI
ncbi:NAD(P)-binding domain superfamily [Arabidopsis suecica]|uniref:NAD(P)-binding domain superfamily n=1 Tax=Arabidopsis suecica TaxID=45249 RepID=A0A8T1YQA9_ARASU|nr:NAD(P)-binding domain superfamily [Arabidopsis suecica]